MHFLIWWSILPYVQAASKGGLPFETQSAAVSLQLWISFLVVKHLMDYLISFLPTYKLAILTLQRPVQSLQQKSHTKVRKKM